MRRRPAAHLLRPRRAPRGAPTMKRPDAHFARPLPPPPVPWHDGAQLDMDSRLLELLVCPLCKGPARTAAHADGTRLPCRPPGVSDPRRGMAVMLESEARSLTADAGSGGGRGEGRRRLSFTVLVPARFASTRLPRKPLADIGGRADGRSRRAAPRALPARGWSSRPTTRRSSTPVRATACRPC